MCADGFLSDVFKRDDCVIQYTVVCSIQQGRVGLCCVDGRCVLYVCENDMIG